jgi:hypothetical protein
MKTFNAKAKCPKCGYKDINTYYCNKQQNASAFTLLCYQHDLKKEHLHRNCKQCHFEWLESCIKKVEP